MRWLSSRAGLWVGGVEWGGGGGGGGGGVGGGGGGGARMCYSRNCVEMGGCRHHLNRIISIGLLSIIRKLREFT